MTVVIPRPLRRCRNCDCYIREVQRKQGICVDKSPTMVPVQMHNPAAALDPKQPPIIQGFQGMWPPTKDDNYCRQWSPQEEFNA